MCIQYNIPCVSDDKLNDLKRFGQEMLPKLISMILGRVISRGITRVSNHPTLGPHLVQRLSESWPIRRAARFTAYVFLRGKQVCFLRHPEFFSITYR